MVYNIQTIMYMIILRVLCNLDKKALQKYNENIIPFVTMKFQEM
jgi:hypothetical protein